MKPVIKIDIVSDVVCPWCYIGKRRLEKAMAQLSSAYDFKLEYHPFELAPELPQEGVSHHTYLVNKFGGTERYDQLTRHVTEVAAGEGLTFDFSRQDKMPNTRKAHSLIQLAKAEGDHLSLVEQLFKAYFTEGIDLSKDENLIQIAVASGIRKANAEAVLHDEHSAVQIALYEQEMRKLGITGVPFYIVNDRYGISGAQPAASFISVIEEINAQVIASDGAQCDIDGNNC
jgi:predicted DsbA family dithiol-disulfide isomerase